MKKAPGHCHYCKQNITARASLQHFHKCLKRQELFTKLAQKKPCLWFFIRAEAGPYWVDILLPKSWHLTELDAFLREKWLECCGHLSCFRIQGTRYESEKPAAWQSLDGPCEDMRAPLENILRAGSTFSHEYDYGSTTELNLKVLEEFSFPLAPKLFECADNDTPVWPCEDCKETASCICSYCYEKYCDSCAEEHSCVMEEGEDVLLPIVNSPRMGVCGYCGPE